jgi:ribonuclease J
MTKREKQSEYLKFIPLGGVGEVTKNMYVYETKNDLVIVDCGIGFFLCT